MTTEEIDLAIHEYSGMVMKMPLSKNWKKHIIKGFAVNETRTGEYDLLILAENPGHLYPFMTKPLKDWLKDNNW
jgi:hypothetical protein